MVIDSPGEVVFQVVTKGFWRSAGGGLPGWDVATVMAAWPLQPPEPSGPYRARIFTLYSSPSSSPVIVWDGSAGKALPDWSVHVL